MGELVKLEGALKRKHVIVAIICSVTINTLWEIGQAELNKHAVSVALEKIAEHAEMTACAVPGEVTAVLHHDEVGDYMIVMGVPY